MTEPSWDKFHELNKVRNCIVHSSGRVAGFRQECFLRRLSQQRIGLHISGANDGTQSATLPLYLEDDILVLEAEYCAAAIEKVRDFFEQLCDQMGLPTMSMGDS